MKTGLAAILLAMTTALPAVASGIDIHVSKTSGCGCCVEWMRHLEASGFVPTGENVTNGALAQLKIAAGITPETASCHTAMVEGYVIEGHVPAADIERLLEERPDAVGLAVPGMPFGSPGMEVGGRVDPYEVLLIRHDGSTEVFSRYPAN